MDDGGRVKGRGGGGGETWETGEERRQGERRGGDGKRGGGARRGRRKKEEERFARAVSRDEFSSNLNPPSHNHQPFNRSTISPVNSSTAGD